MSKELPEFKTAEEEAEFWETHSADDYWSQMEPVEIEVEHPKRRLVSIRFDINILEQVRRIAKAKGVPYQTLVQLWVAEKVAENQKETGS